MRVVVKNGRVVTGSSGREVCHAKERQAEEVVHTDKDARLQEGSQSAMVAAPENQLLTIC